MLYRQVPTVEDGAGAETNSFGSATLVRIVIYIHKNYINQVIAMVIPEMEAWEIVGYLTDYTSTCIPYTMRKKPIEISRCSRYNSYL
jgi:hypothetical protein